MNKTRIGIAILYALAFVMLALTVGQTQKRPPRLKPGEGRADCAHGSVRVTCRHGYAPLGQCQNGVPAGTCLAPGEQP